MFLQNQIWCEDNGQGIHLIGFCVEKGMKELSKVEELAEI